MRVVEAGAVADAVKVTVALQVGLQGLLVNAEAVTPDGRAVRILNVKGVVVPDERVAVAVSTPPAAPSVIDNVAGLTARVSTKQAQITKLKVVVLVMPPPTAWIVTVVVEEGAVADAVNVTVAEHVGLQLAGVNALAVTPRGSVFGILKVIGVGDPARRVAVTVSTPPGPLGKIVKFEGVVVRQRSKGPPAPQVITRLKVVVLVMPPPVA